MGWWSTDIMGGDTPLDFEDQFYDICKVNKYPEKGKRNNLSKEDLENNLTEIVNFLDENRWGENHIGGQVLAVLMMRAGASISDNLKAAMIEACEEDQWAKEDYERHETINGLISALNAYDGTPIEIRSRGLFEVMEEKLNNENNQNQ